MKKTLQLISSFCAFSIVVLCLTGCRAGSQAPAQTLAQSPAPGSGSGSGTSPSPTPAPSPAASPTPAPAAGLNYYVSPSGSDSNSGSVSAPWLTLQHAANMAKPGAVVHVAPGQYAGLTTNISGTAQARIRFVSDTKWGALVRSTTGDAVWRNYANYIDIAGFDISGSGSNMRLGIANDASYVRIIGNNVHDILPPCDSNGAAGINDEEYVTSDNDIIGNVVHDIGNPAVSCSTVQGIYHSNLRGHILNNISYRNQAYGIHLWHAAKDVVVANNLVFQNGEGGIFLGAGDSPGGITASGMVVVNNIVMDHSNRLGAGYAIVESGLTDTTNYYGNNLIWNNALGISLQNGLTDINTINADPLLVNYQPNGSGDYHLQPGSPAINAGTTKSMPATDFDGAPRPIGTAPDIGAYEFGSTPSPWPWM